MEKTNALKEVSAESGNFASPGRRFLSVQSVATRWNVSDSTVRRLIDEGELKGIKIRRTFKILAESVCEYESRSSF